MKRIKFWFISGIIFTSVFGTLSHFFYDWSGENPLIGLISPVNESTWEHMKLLFFPVLIWSFFIPIRIREACPGLRPALLLSNIAGTLSIPVLFYAYTYIIGKSILWIDISIFYISVLLTYYWTWLLKNSDRIYEKRTAVYAMTVLFLSLFFLISISLL